MRHQAVWRDAVPVHLARLEENAISGPDLLDRAAQSLAAPDALGDVNGLAVWVGVPCRAYPGATWTLTANTRDSVEDVAMTSRETAPVDHFAGATTVPGEILEICIVVACSACAIGVLLHRGATPYSGPTSGCGTFGSSSRATSSTLRETECADGGLEPETRDVRGAFS